MNKKCKTIKEQNRKPCNAPQTTDACSHLIIYIPFISCHTRCHTFLLFIVTVYTWHCQKKEADDFSESITASIVHDWVCFPSFVSTLFGCGHSILATWFKLYATSDPSAWSWSTRIIYTRTVEMLASLCFHWSFHHQHKRIYLNEIPRWVSVVHQPLFVIHVNWKC